MNGSRLRVAVTLVFVAITGAMVAQGQGGTQEELDGECFSCHQPEMPLRTMYLVQPPPTLEVEPGEEFTYQVQVNHVWTTKLELRAFTASLDLAEAPGLSFVTDEVPPAIGSQEGSIPLDPSTINLPQTASLQVEVAPGATDVQFVVRPADTTPAGPDLRLTIKPSVGDDIRVNNAGAGQPEVFSLKGASAVASAGFGNWTIDVSYRPIDPNAVPPVSPATRQAVGFTMEHGVWFNTTGATKQFVFQQGPITGGQALLLSWQLKASSEPVSSEQTVRARVNVTAYYDHVDAGNPDYGNYTKGARVLLSALGTGEGLLLQDPEAQGTILIVPRQGSVSMARISEAVGYATGFLLLGSVWSGGMFGKASRRQLNSIFGSAKRRVAFHNFVSYALTVAAIVHLVLFIIEIRYHWSLGLIWGGVALLAMLGLGVTGAVQIPLIRSWGYPMWRWTHLGLAIAALAFTVLHMLLDGANFTDVAQAVGWEDPLVKWLDSSRVST